MTDEADSINRVVNDWQAGRDREENFRHLFERYYHRLHRFFQKRGFSTDEADDLTQETFFCIYSGLETFRREARFETWLFQIASNTYRQAERRQAAARRGGGSISPERSPGQPQTERDENVLNGLISTSGPLDEVLVAERQRVLTEAIEALPTQMRQCIILRGHQELSYREIALVMGISVETVKSHLFQARQRLREKLNDYLGERGGQSERGAK
jgi:RNA polymerase sigma-70 factor (ECF subfamily)